MAAFHCAQPPAIFSDASGVTAIGDQTSSKGQSASFISKGFP